MILLYYVIKCKVLFCLDLSIKIHDLVEMKEIYAIITVEDAGGEYKKKEIFDNHI